MEFPEIFLKTGLTPRVGAALSIEIIKQILYMRRQVDRYEVCPFLIEMRSDREMEGPVR